MTVAPKMKQALKRVAQAADTSSLETHSGSATNEAEQLLLPLEERLRATVVGAERLALFLDVGRDIFSALHELGCDLDAWVTHVANEHDLWGVDDVHEPALRAFVREIIGGQHHADNEEIGLFADEAWNDEPPMHAEPPGHEADQAPLQLPPLTINEWHSREISAPDYLLGSALSTTNRWLIIGPTGIGKTNFALGMGMGMAAGNGFLHWKGVRPSSVLYVDGEMSNLLVKQRVCAEVHRRGAVPSGFRALCAADVVDDFAPLNTELGRSFMWSMIERIGKVDLVIFDNVMALLGGDMVGEGPWAEVMPFVRSLTRRGIGQVWIHHTGHRDDRGFGTKTREWSMDAVAILEAEKRPDTDVSFRLTFSKARERAPWNRGDFRDVEIALVDDRWQHRFPGQDGQSVVTGAPARISPKAGRIFDALSTIALSGKPVSDDAWKAECSRLGLIDVEKDASARAQFSKYRKELTEAAMVVSEGGQSWLRR